MYESVPFFRSCEEESIDGIETQVTGVLPTWLNGTLLRNGGGKRKFGDTSFNHAFDGMSLIHQFKINGREGIVFYKNRFLRSKSFQKNTKANRIVVGEFGTKAFPDPCLSLLGRFMAWFVNFSVLSDNANVSIVPVGDEVYASTEIPTVTRIDLETLETTGQVDFSKIIAVNTHT